MKRLLHFFPTISHLGGVETILRLHCEKDAAFGWESKVLIGCESDETCRRFGAVGLGVRGWRNTADLRRGFSRFYHEFQPDALVIHNLWAGRHLLPLASRSMNVGFIHTASEESWIALANCRDYLDMIIGISPQIAQQAQQMVSENVEVTTTFCPISPPPPPTRSRQSGTPFVIGYCGRVVVEQKRCDRLADIMEQALKSSADVRFEVMGDGPYGETLQQRFGANPKVALLGRKSGSDYWNRLQSWDAIISTSDYEGTPIGLLEALSQGVVPVYPRINSGGDTYAEEIDPNLLYEKEDVAGAVKKLILLSQSDEAKLAPLRATAITLTLKNRPEKYLESFFASIDAGLAASHHHERSVTATKSTSWRDHVPFYFVRKFMPRWVY